MDILNLDDFAKATRSVTFAGVTYAVHEMSVSDFIDTTKETEKLKDSTSFVDQIELTVSIAKRSIPDMPEATIRGLRLEQLIVLSKFLRNELTEAGDAGKESAQEAAVAQEGEAGKE